MKTCSKLVGWLLAGMLTGCQLFDSDQRLPVYLKLPPGLVQVETPTGVVISNHGVKDAWLDHNGTFMGVHRLGRVIPLLPDKDRNQLAIRGGIFENGLSGIRSAYPFWRPITIEIDAEPLDTVELDLTFEYFERDSILEIPLEETFESGGTSRFTSANAQANAASLELTSQEVYQGDRSGIVRITPNSYDFRATSSTRFALPRSSDNDIYLEVTYRNTVPFTVSMLYNNLSQTDIQNLPIGVEFLSPDEWNTVYIHLLPLVQTTAEDGVYRIVLEASGRDPQTGNIETGVIYFDNIRLVAFRP
jgi:hypothetical protein